MIDQIVIEVGCAFPDLTEAEEAELQDRLADTLVDFLGWLDSRGKGELQCH